MANIVLVNPAFTPSYWGMEYVQGLFGKRATMPVASLPLLSALTPPEHHVTLLDENVTALDFDRLARADIVGVTGMIVQRSRMREILQELKARGAFTVVGGAWVTVSEDYFGDLADVIFVGEAEETWPRFLREWETGDHVRRYQQPQPTEMSRVPCPHYDRLETRRYMFGSLQISRGCPFQCEFCDIIVTFGRRPRLKSAEQVIAELEALRGQGIDIAMIVDDNLIGNKRVIRPVLQAIAAWQRRNGYAFIFFAQASLDLADDAELMQLFVEANVQTVFIGIESPNQESLRETLKFQNLRAGGSMVEKIRRIQNAGLEVWTGMIVGFDHDDETVFEAQEQFLEEARIVHAMVGMLYAIPKTPLHARLLADGRLDPDDQPIYGTNVIPLKMTREQLTEGYVRVNRRLNDVRRFFDRADSLYLDLTFQFGRSQRDYWRRHPLAWLHAQGKNVARCMVLYYRLMRHVDDAALRAEYRRRIRRVWRARRDPAVLFIYLIKCAAHYHYARVCETMDCRDRALVNTF